MTYYFAYGSNMNLSQMCWRCPGARMVGKGTLYGWRLVERQHADIDRARGGKVQGVVWAVDADHLVALDRYEGCPRYYIRVDARVNVKGRMVRCVAYEMTAEAKRRQQGMRFSPGYARACREGAEENGVPVSRLFAARAKEDDDAI